MVHYITLTPFYEGTNDPNSNKEDKPTHIEKNGRDSRERPGNKNNSRAKADREYSGAVHHTSTSSSRRGNGSETRARSKEWSENGSKSGTVASHNDTIRPIRAAPTLLYGATGVKLEGGSINNVKGNTSELDLVYANVDRLLTTTHSYQDPRKWGRVEG